MQIIESFVQNCIESYFLELGYDCKHEKRGIDLVATQHNKETWIIEAKGETKQPRTDFCTCIGQLVCRMNEPDCRYGLAVPKTKQYIHQIKQLSVLVRQQLNLYILLVNESGKIEIITPSDSYEGYCKI